MKTIYSVVGVGFLLFVVKVFDISSSTGGTKAFSRSDWGGGHNARCEDTENITITDPYSVALT